MAYAIFGSGDFERACCDVDSSSISGDTITIVPQAYNALWRVFLFKLTGADSNQPTFKIDWDASAHSHTNYTSSLIGNTNWVPCFTYDIDDYDSWTYASAITNSSGYVEFQFDSAFTQDTVYVSFVPVVRPSKILSWITGLTGISETATGTSYGGDDYQINLIASVTDENSRVIPAQKQYAFKFGTGATKIVWLGGMHASEDLGSVALIECVNWMLSDHPIAQSVRDSATIYVYPLINPQGRWGGHYRPTFESGYESYDPNADWNDTSGFLLDCTTNTKDAIATDVGATNIDIIHDFHSKGGAGLIYHGQSIPFADDLQAWVDEYTACVRYNTSLTYSGVTAASIPYYTAAGAGFGTTNETGEQSGAPSIDICKRLAIGTAMADSVGLYSENTTTAAKILDLGSNNTSRYYEIANNDLLDLPDSEWGMGFWTRVDAIGASYPVAVCFGSIGAAGSFYFYIDATAGSWEFAISSDDGTFPGYIQTNDGYGADSVERLWVLRRKVSKFEIWSVTPGNDPVLEYEVNNPFDSITCPAKLYIGCNNIQQAGRFYLEHLGGFFWKNDGAIEYEDMKSIGWGLINPDDTDLLTSPPNIYFAMDSADATLTDSISALTATRVGSSWPVPSVEIPYRVAGGTPVSALYDCRVGVINEHIFTFDQRAAASNERTSSADTKVSIGNQEAIVVDFDTLLGVSNELTGSYDTKTSIRTLLTIAADSLLATSTELTETYDTKVAIGNQDTIVVTFDTLTVVRNSLAKSFDSKAAVSTDVSALIDTLTKSSQARTFSADTKTSIHNESVTLYDTKAVISGLLTVIQTFDTLVGVNTVQELAYDLRAIVTDASACVNLCQSDIDLIVDMVVARLEAIIVANKLTADDVWEYER